MLKSKFEKFLVFLKNKRIIITTHDLVDIDGFTSCYTLKFFLNQYFKNQKISIYFSEISNPTKNFMEHFTLKFPEFMFSYEKEFKPSKVDVLLILDTNDLNQIKPDNNFDISSLKIPYIFIDHHYVGEQSGNWNKNTLNLILEEYSSTAEIIFNFFNFYDIELPNPFKVLIIAAIIADSGFFKYGSNKTIQNVNKLLSEDINIQEILLLLKRDISISEKIARIKGFQRVKLIRKGEYLIGITNVNSFGAIVASMLIKQGFDVAIVFSKEADLYRLNTRAKKRVCIETGLHLGKILEGISDQYEGSGGGHDGAAALSTKTDIETIITQIIKKIKLFL
ncbi:MAG: bifunctional oligoribonuclease/PAP phosphatase NrnA [Candidatus Hodarchaeota archaeon]